MNRLPPARTTTVSLERLQTRLRSAALASAPVIPPTSIPSMLMPSAILPDCERSTA